MSNISIVSVQEFNKMCREFWLRFKAAPQKWQPSQFGISSATKNEVRKAFASNVKMYYELAKHDKVVKEAIESFVTGFLSDDSDDGQKDLEAIVASKES